MTKIVNKSDIDFIFDMINNHYEIFGYSNVRWVMFSYASSTEDRYFSNWSDVFPINDIIFKDTAHFRFKSVDDKCNICFQDGDHYEYFEGIDSVFEYLQKMVK